MPVSTVSATKQTGFTFIEMLVVGVIIAVLAAIVAVSFVTTGRFTRDARRKRDLANTQAALESYKQYNGIYPESTVCGGDFTWPGCDSDWIPGIQPDYLEILPVDPKSNYEGEISNLSTQTYTYNYTRLTNTSYQLLTRLENDDDASINGSTYGYTGSNIYVVVQPR